MANGKKVYELKQSGLWYKSRNAPCDGKTHFYTTTNKMLESGLKYQRPLSDFEKKVLNNNSKDFYFSNHDNRYKDHIFPEHLDKNLGRIKLPEIRKLSILPTYDKAIPINPNHTKPKTKVEFISEYLASYKDVGPCKSTGNRHKYPKCYSTPNPGFRTSANQNQISKNSELQPTVIQKSLKTCGASELKPWRYCYKLKSKNIYNQPKKAF